MTEQLIEDIKTSDDIELFRKFVSSLGDINEFLIQSEDNSLNLLHICVGFDESEFSLQCIQHLLSLPDININSLAKIEGTLGISGAHIAVDWSHYTTLNTLIESGIDLFICDSYGSSASDYAIKRGDQRAEQLIQKAIDNYLCSKFYSFQVLDNHLINSNIKSNSCGKDLKNKINPKPESPKEGDLRKTTEYFDENKNIWKKVDNKSDDSYDSENRNHSLISNISYEKTESVKSFCSDKTQVYVYNDKDHKVVLIEERFEGCANNSSSDQSLNERQTIAKGCVTQTTAYEHMKAIELMNGTQIFNELRAMGDTPGPVLPSTKKYYEKRLLNLRRGTLSPSKQVLPLPNHSSELNLLIQKKFPFEEVLELEKQIINFFEDNNCKKIDNNFIYLLIDPNISENIPLQANGSKIVVNCCAQIDINLLSKFIKSIFYVGKGQGNRVYQHFYEAIKLDDTQKMCPKVKRIHEIWSSNKGVTSLHCFHDISSGEAFAREAMIIEALGLSNLTNQISGKYNRKLRWNERKRRLFGSYLLFKSFGIYVLTGERQIRRPDH